MSFQKDLSTSSWRISTRSKVSSFYDHGKTYLTIWSFYLIKKPHKLFCLFSNESLGWILKTCYKYLRTKSLLLFFIRRVVFPFENYYMLHHLFFILFQHIKNLNIWWFDTKKKIHKFLWLRYTFQNIITS